MEAHFNNQKQVLMEIQSTCMTFGIWKGIQFLIYTNSSQLLLSLIPSSLVSQMLWSFLYTKPPTTIPTLVHEICLSLSTLHCSSSYYVPSLCKKSCVITRYFLSLALSNMFFRKIKTEFLLGEGARRDEKYVHNLGGRLCVMETEPSDINGKHVYTLGHHNILSVTKNLFISKNWNPFQFSRCD